MKSVIVINAPTRQLQVNIEHNQEGRLTASPVFSGSRILATRVLEILLRPTLASYMYDAPISPDSHIQGCITACTLAAREYNADLSVETKYAPSRPSEPNVIY